MTGHDIGSRVRLAREQRGLSLADAARLTRLSTRVIQAIERNDFASLPAGMYRKAYLRMLAAEVGLDAAAIAAEYEAQFEPEVEPASAINGHVTVTDRWIDELRPPPRRAIVTLTAFAALLAVWFMRQSPRDPVDTGLASANYELRRTALVAPPGGAAPGSESEAARVAATATSTEMPLKVALTTTGSCWVAAQSDGNRVVYGLLEPGTRVVVEGRHRIVLRLGDAGSVRLSINGGADRTPGADGEVVEMEITSDDLELETANEDIAL